MEVFAHLVLIIGPIAGIFMIYTIWKDHQENKHYRASTTELYKGLAERAVSSEALSKEALNAKLETHRKIVDLATKVKDLEVEIHNFQDHIARNDRDVIDLNRTFSKLRPVYKIVLPREELPKVKPRPRARVSQ